MTNKAKLKQQTEEMEAKLCEMRAELETGDKWEPPKGAWYIGSDGEVGLGRTTDDYRLFGMERKTKAAAEKARDEMQEYHTLLAYRDAFAPDYVPDWTEEGEAKCYVYFRFTESEWLIGIDYTAKDAGKVYMPYDIAEELANKLNSGEVEL